MNPLDNDRGSIELRMSATGGPSTGVDIAPPLEPAEGNGPDWDAVHVAIQRSFDELARRVIESCPGATWKASRASARAYPLFSYHTFYHLDGDDYDPIIVGITCLPAGIDVELSGDISCDESGFIYFEEGCQGTASSQTGPILKVATEIAGRMASQYQIVIDAIRDRRPEATPR